MSDKIKRLAGDASDTLQLTPNGAKYLESVIEMAFGYGKREGLERGREITMEVLKQKGSE